MKQKVFELQLSANDYQKVIHHCNSYVSSCTLLTTQFTLWKDNLLKPSYYVTLIDVAKNLTLFRMGVFMTAHGWGRGKKASHP